MPPIHPGPFQDRGALPDQVSRAWPAFARAGNPGHDGLPKWPAFHIDQRAAVIFDHECMVIHDPGREERLRTRGRGLKAVELKRETADSAKPEFPNPGVTVFRHGLLAMMALRKRQG